MNLVNNDLQAAFETLPLPDQVQAIRSMTIDRQRASVRVLDPDDAADLLQSLENHERVAMLALLDSTARAEVSALLAYSEDVAGGLMNPRYVRVRPGMNVQEAILYVRRQIAGNPGTSSYIYVLSNDQKLMGVLSMKELFVAAPMRTVSQIMRTEIVSLKENCNQEEVANTFAAHRLIAIPVVDGSGVMKGVVTADDVVQVVRHEATEDMQKMGGSEALDSPYLNLGLGSMIKKRGGWLVMLFLGEMLTASAMARYEDALARAVVLALFVPLIISSGGNAGSQASTLVIRAMALGEVKLKDWWKVMRREFATGLALGGILGTVGLLRIVLWEQMFGTYGEHFFLLAITVSLSLVGVVLWGSIVGSLLPFVLRRLRFDPASASTPFVATLVDVTGLIIYFSLASAVLMGRLV